MMLLKFGLGNAKLSGLVATFSLPAGWACPFAKECMARTDRITGKLTDGPDTLYRCFSASGECRGPSVRNARWHNFDLLLTCKSVQEMADLITNSLPLGTSIVRLHVSGDFFNETYFKAWLNVAIAHPNILFYGYTKALPYLVKYLTKLPANFRLVASKGGTHDHLISEHNLVYAEVVFHETHAANLGLDIDHDDSLAMKAVKPFALLLHATQPKGSIAADAWKIIKKTVGGYSRNRKRITQGSLKTIELEIA